VTRIREKACVWALRLLPCTTSTCGSAPRQAAQCPRQFLHNALAVPAKGKKAVQMTTPNPFHACCLSLLIPQQHPQSIRRTHCNPHHCQLLITRSLVLTARSVTLALLLGASSDRLTPSSFLSGLFFHVPNVKKWGHADFSISTSAASLPVGSLPWPSRPSWGLVTPVLRAKP